MARLEKSLAGEICRECPDPPGAIAMMTIVVNNAGRIPLCRRHADELVKSVADLAAESLTSG